MQPDIRKLIVRNICRAMWIQPNGNQGAGFGALAQFSLLAFPVMKVSWTRNGICNATGIWIQEDTAIQIRGMMLAYRRVHVQRGKL
jgi:hypothetical protein